MGRKVHWSAGCFAFIGGLAFLLWSLRSDRLSNPLRNYSTSVPNGFCAVVTTNPASTSTIRSDEDYWLNGCQLERRVECNNFRRTYSLLVVYVSNQQPHNSSRLKGPFTEWENLDFFMRHGILPESQSTELFRSVDYAFVAVGSVHKSLYIDNKSENQYIIHMPSTPCLMCSYRTALKLMLSVNSWEYFVLMDSEVKGPFLAPGSGYWVDILFAIASRPSDGAAASAVTVHTSMIAGNFTGISAAFSNFQCKNTTAIMCTQQSSMIHSAIQNHSIDIYSLEHLSLLPLADVPTPSPSKNPSFVDACSTMFVRFSSDGIREKTVLPRTFSAVRFLALNQDRVRNNKTLGKLRF